MRSNSWRYFLLVFRFPNYLLSLGKQPNVNNFEEVSRFFRSRELRITPNILNIQIFRFLLFSLLSYSIRISTPTEKSQLIQHLIRLRFRSITLPAPCWCDLLMRSSGTDGGGVFRGVALRRMSAAVPRCLQVPSLEL